MKDMNIKQNYFTIVALPALLAFGFLAVTSRGFGADSPQPSPAISPTPVSEELKNNSKDGVPLVFSVKTPAHGVNPMTDKYFKIILDDLAANGATASLREAVATALGLTHNGETVKVREDSFKDEFKASHVIASLEHDGGYIICCATKEKTQYYLIDKNRWLVAAVVRPADGPVTVVPYDLAQRQLDYEWIFWTNTAIKLEDSK
jgi:hypothetical protein